MMSRLNRFCRRLIVTLMVAISLSSISNNPAHSQTALNIAAIVNDDVISIYDLSQRILSVITFSNLPNTVETQQRIAPDILRRLISEKLRLQEAKRLKITVPDEDIKKAISDLERQNKIPPGQMDQMLLSHGVDPDSLKQQLIAELSWIGVVRSLFRNIATVSDQEVDDVITKMKENAGKPEYHVAEIFLAYDEKPKSEVNKIAQRIHEQLAAGASWPQMAHNFSESASASDGGDLGWNLASDLSPAIGGVVSRLELGQMSSPVTTDDGVYILSVREKRIAKGIEASPEEITLGIQQLHMLIPANANSQSVTAITNKAKELADSANDCKSFASIAKSEGSPQSGFLGKFNINQLNPQLKSIVQNLKVNQSSQPFRTPDGVIVLMVCTREASGGKDPVAEARTQIESHLLNQRLGRMAAQHEEKLRRQAFIDIRL